MCDELGLHQNAVLRSSFCEGCGILLPSKALIGQGWFALDTFLETLVNMLLVVGLEHVFPYDLGMSSSQVTNSYVSEGFFLNHQPAWDFSPWHGIPRLTVVIRLAF